MKITAKEVEHVATLARLNLTEAEKGSMIRELNAILDHMDKLNRLDTDDVEPTFHVQPMVNVFRADQLRNSMDRGDILRNAPDQEDGCFRVEKVIEG